MSNSLKTQDGASCWDATKANPTLLAQPDCYGATSTPSASYSVILWLVHLGLKFLAKFY